MSVPRAVRSVSAALVGPVQYFFFLAVHYFNSCVSIAQQAEQAVVLGRLSFRMCLWARLPAQLAGRWGQIWKKAAIEEKKNFVLDRLRNSQGRKKISCTGMTSQTNQSRKAPYQMFSLSPYLPQFQNPVRPISLSLYL